MILLQADALHAFVIRTAPAFRHDPVNDLVGIGDVAGLAMNAIGGVNFQFELAVGILGHFVDRRGAKILARIAVLYDALCGSNIQIAHDQVAGLIFLVAGAGMIDIGEPVKSEFAITLETRRFRMTGL